MMMKKSLSQVAAFCFGALSTGALFPSRADGNVCMVGITGGSGAGKTTLAVKLASLLEKNSSQVCNISQDRYYLPHGMRSAEGVENFDHPFAFNHQLLRTHLRELQAGNAVEIPLDVMDPRYPAQKAEKVGPCQVIILEGIHAFYDEAIREQLNLKIFVDLDDQERLSRRLVRDEKERNCPQAETQAMYDSMVRPMYDRFIEPAKTFADRIISGNQIDAEAKQIAEQINELISPQFEVIAPVQSISCVLP